MKRPGNIRVSATDVMVLASAALFTAALWKRGLPGWWVPATVVGHFFLFCNVFRVPRRLELTWAVGFIGITAYWISQGRLEFVPVVLSITPFTVLVIARTLRLRKSVQP